MAMDFKNIEKNFEKKHTTRYVYTEYQTYEIKWAFENFEKLLLKPTFQASLSVNLDFQIDTNLIHKIDGEIDKLREFYHRTSHGLQKYLLETDDEVLIENTYKDFLNNFYKNFKDYVNEGLIPWIFANVMHKDVKQGSLTYQPKLYLEYCYQKFELKMMKKMKQYLKKVANSLPTDQTYPILLKAYDQKIVESEKTVQHLKAKSLA